LDLAGQIPVPAAVLSKLPKLPKLGKGLEKLGEGVGRVWQKVSVPRTAVQRSFSERVADFQANPQNWQRAAASAEQATSRAGRGGVSVENLYRNPVTGETLHVHDVFKPSGAQIPKHPTFRDYGKGE
jgi:hypothetical protein